MPISLKGSEEMDSLFFEVDNLYIFLHDVYTPMRVFTRGTVAIPVLVSVERKPVNFLLLLLLPIL